MACLHLPNPNGAGDVVDSSCIIVSRVLTIFVNVRTQNMVYYMMFSILRGVSILRAVSILWTLSSQHCSRWFFERNADHNRNIIHLIPIAISYRPCLRTAQCRDGIRWSPPRFGRARAGAGYKWMNGTFDIRQLLVFWIFVVDWIHGRLTDKHKYRWDGPLGPQFCDYITEMFKQF